jgi:hypothetical protein
MSIPKFREANAVEIAALLERGKVTNCFNGATLEGCGICARASNNYGTELQDELAQRHLVVFPKQPM